MSWWAQHRVSVKRLPSSWPGEMRPCTLTGGVHSDGPANLIHARCDVLAEDPTFPRIDDPVDGLAYLPGTISLKPFHLLRRKDFVQDLEVNYLGAVRLSANSCRRFQAATSQ
jgi:hypothetical protein